MKLLIVLGLVCCAFAKPSFRPRPRVINGEDAQEGEFPYQISYQWGFLGITQHTCGGSIISDSWILTAGHCITMAPQMGEHLVVAGISNLKEENPQRQEVKVVELIPHKDYANNVGPNDIGLLKLEHPLEFSDLVQPISLPSAGSVPSGDAVLSGWGATFNIIIQIMPQQLQKATLPILENTECNEAFADAVGSQPNPYSLTSNICTGPMVGNHGVCSGDSGGPLAQGNTIVGVVSWGSSTCGIEGIPSVFTKVSSFLDFIEEHTGLKPGN